MTIIDADTSPLQAAREWRGVSLASAALGCGLTVRHAEALEAGDVSAFDTTDELIAAAVLYGTSIGIGRDEALALLDRTTSGGGASVALPDVAQPIERPNASFSRAVHDRDLGSRAAFVDHSVEDEHTRDDIDGDVNVHGPTPDQAVAASGELHLDHGYDASAPWEQERAPEVDLGATGEFDADWFDDLEPPAFGDFESEPVTRSRQRDAWTASLHAPLERVLGPARARGVVERLDNLSATLIRGTRQARTRLSQSEHGTLFAAIAGGAVLIAVVVALGGALSGGSDSSHKSASTAHSTTSTAASDGRTASVASPDAATPPAASTATKPAAKPAMLAPARMTVDVFNVGRRKGLARQTADVLKVAGYRLGDVGNAKGRYPGAMIVYPAGRVREAQLLARRTGIGSLQQADGSASRFVVVVD